MICFVPGHFFGARPSLFPIPRSEDVVIVVAAAAANEEEALAAASLVCACAIAVDVPSHVDVANDDIVAEFVLWTTTTSSRHWWSLAVVNANAAPSRWILLLPLPFRILLLRWDPYYYL